MINLICRSILLTAFLILLSCASNNHNPRPSNELINLTNYSSFQLNGKMSFSDGSEGGSGQVIWHKQANEQTVVLKAPLSKKSWTLVESLATAYLQTHDGERLYGQSATELINNQVGWEVPWLQLQSWVIGQPTSTGQLNWSDDLQYFVINDQGWEIQYSKLKAYHSGVLPHKIIARKSPYSIKLSIKTWHW